MRRYRGVNRLISDTEKGWPVRIPWDRLMKLLLSIVKTLQALYCMAKASKVALSGN